MTVPVQFLFDFGSPNAYMCHRVIPAIEARTGVAFEYVPVLLGGIFKLSGNRSPAEAFAGIPNKRAYDQLEIKRFVAKHQLDRYRHNPFWPVNTLQIMRGAVAAQKQGCFERYVEAVYVAMWEEGRNMEDPEVKSLLMANTQAAFERGAFGSPTFFVGSEIFFGKDRLREVEEEIVRANAA